MAAVKDPAKGVIRIVAIVIALAVMAGLFANAISTQLQDRRPNLASRINPLNVDARLARILRRMSKSDELGALGLGAIGEFAREAIKKAPLDPRAYSLLAEIESRQGNTDTAGALFDHVAAQAPTDFLLLQWRVNQAFRGENYKEAADALQVLALRWPDQWAVYAPGFLSMLATNPGRAALAQIYHDDDRQRRVLLTRLRESPEGARLAAGLIQALHAQSAPNLEREISRSLRQLAANDDITAAQSLFLFTLGEDEFQAQGFLNDPQFQSVADKGPFGWSLRNSPGVDITRLERAEGGLELRFRDTPVRLRALEQSTLLYDGIFNLVADLTADLLSTPQPLYLVVRCRGGENDLLGQIEIPQGSYKNRIETLQFTVFGSDCGAQRVYLTNRVSGLDWSQKNNGTIRINSLRIVSAGESN